MTCLYVLLLTVPPALADATAKLLKIRKLSPHAGGVAVARALSGDVAFYALWLLAWTLALHLVRGHLRRGLAVLLHLGTLTLLFLVVVEHGFWLTTGALLDWPMMEYTFQHFAMLRRVIGGEITPPVILAFAVVGILAVWPLALPRWRAWWAQSEPHVAGDGRKLFAGTLLAVLPALVLRAAPLPERMLPLDPAPALAIGGGALRATLHLDLAAAEVVAQVRPVQPLVVTRGPKTHDYNVVLIVLESTRASSTTPYDAKLASTPFLDKLARKGVRVDTAYTTIPHTTKSLVPVHCGIWPKITPFFEEATPGALPTDCLAGLLRRQGWATGYFMASESVFERNRELVGAFGFDTLVAKEELERSGDAKGFEEVNYFGYEDNALLKPALRWVDAQKGKPFLQAFLTLTSHHPYALPKSWKRQKFSEDPKLDDYLNTLRYTDAFVESLYNEYEKRGLNDHTVWLLIGDHGEGFGEHGVFQHDTSLYEEMLRVPLIVAGPGIQPRTVGGLRQNIDVLPTLLDALGLQVMAGDLVGRSVLSEAGHERLYFSCWHKEFGLGLREAGRKLIWSYDKKPTEVFDLAHDASETNNVAATMTAAQLAREIKALKHWQAEVNARWDDQAQRRRTPFVSHTRPTPTHPTDIQFGDFARLIGYDRDASHVVAGDALWVTCYYEVLKDPGPGWELFVHLLGPQGHYARADHVPVEGSHPVAKWKVGEFITDRTYLRFDPGVPSGRFDAFIGFYNSADKDHRAGVSGTGLPLDFDNRVLLAQIDVDNPRRPPVVPPPHRDALPESRKGQVHAAPVDGAQPLEIRFGKAIRLFRVDGGGTPVRRGQSVTLHYHFLVEARPPRFTDGFLHIHGPKERYVNDSHAALGGEYPVEKWEAGDVIDEVHTWQVPADWPLGRTEFWLGFWNPNLTTPDQRLPVTDGKVGPAVKVADLDKGRARAAVVDVVP